MRREYYNYIKENVKNNLNKKLLNEVLVDDPIEHYTTPPQPWRRHYVPFANQNPAVNQPTFANPPEITPSSSPPGLGGGTLTNPDKTSPEFVWTWDATDRLWRLSRKVHMINSDGQVVFYYQVHAGSGPQNEPNMGQVFWNPDTQSWQRWRGWGRSIGRWSGWIQGMWP